MDIVRLPVGEVPPLDEDCLRIEEQPGGSFALTGSAMRSGDNDSVSMAGGSDFASAEAAEQAGVAWANEVGVEYLYIGVGTLDRPLELTEADLPLHSGSPGAA